MVSTAVNVGVYTGVDLGPFCHCSAILLVSIGDTAPAATVHRSNTHNDT